MDKVKPELTITISMMSEIAQAISHLSPDRALLFLVESAVSVAELDGAVLLVPNEKQNTTICFVKSFRDDFNEPKFNESFHKTCFKIFSKIRDKVVSTRISEISLDKTYGNKNAYAMPVMLSGKPVALLVIIKKADHFPICEECSKFLEFITPFMGSLMENFRLNNEIIQKNSRLSALYEISQQTESLIDFRDVYDSLGKVAKSFINFDVYRLYLLNSDKETLEAKVSIGEEASTFKKIIKVGEGPVGLAAKEGRPYLTFTKAFNSVLILPVEVSGNLMGIVTVASRKAYAYRDEDIIGLRIIATQIASIDLMFKDLIQLRGVTERILESITSGVVIFDKENKVTYSNSALTHILSMKLSNGWSPFGGEEILPEKLHKLFCEVLKSNLTLDNQKLVLKELAPMNIVEINAFPFQSESGDMLGTAFFIKDITKMAAMEDQLKRADRLSALGVLAAGIAHEIRNPLTGMKMIVQILAGDFSSDDARREPLGIIQNEIDRLERIIGNLLDFARPSKPVAVSIDICEIVDACYLLVKNQLKKQNINYTKFVEEGCPKVLGDPDQLKQVFLNILTNAIQALKTGGNLDIDIRYERNFVVVKFTDTGIGIHPEKLQDIFNPFMTTKEDGTGLGLSMAQRIVEEHGGRIEVSSVLSEGSCFKIWLPVMKGIKAVQ